MNTLHPDISDTCTQADEILWDAYARSAGNRPDLSGEGRLVFPRYRDEEKLRVSEQEARFAFVEALSGGHLKYSVEVPTTKRYSFKGKGSRSASTDLQVHKANESICNIEFKAQGVSTAAADNSSICKDVQKLLREPVWGLWFHLLKSIDRSSIKNILDVIAEKIGKTERVFNDIEAPGLTIHICVLQPGFSLQKDILLSVNEAELAYQLCVDPQVSVNELKEEEHLNGWKLERKCRQ